MSVSETTKQLKPKKSHILRSLDLHFLRYYPKSDAGETHEVAKYKQNISEKVHPNDAFVGLSEGF